MQPHSKVLPPGSISANAPPTPRVPWNTELLGITRLAAARDPHGALADRIRT